MFEDEDLKKLVESVGAICEMAGMLRDELIRCKFTREEAVNIVANYMLNLLLK